MIWVEHASAADYFCFMGGQKIPAFTLKVDGEPVAMAGVMDRFGDGDWWAFLNTRGYLKKSELRHVLRNVRHFLENFEYPVKVQCAALQNAASEKLLTKLGFQPTGERLHGFEVWTWQRH